MSQSSIPPRNEPLTVLMVCEGNICRSPFAEEALRFSLPSSTVNVHSCGTNALVGQEMEPEMATLFKQLTGSTPHHVAQQISSYLAAHSDLILTMTSTQRDEVASNFPRFMKRIFAISEFAAIVEELHARQGNSSLASPRQLLALAASSRHLVSSHVIHDIDDPYRRSEETHRRVADELLRLSKKISGFVQ